MTKLTITESEHQKVVIEWSRLHEKKWPCLKYLYACPNEGKHKPQYRKHQAQMGLKAGVPDIFLPLPSVYNGGPEPLMCGEVTAAHGLFIELKAGKNKPTEAQQGYIDYLREQGYQVEVCYSAGEAIKVIESYLKLSC